VDDTGLLRFYLDRGGPEARWNLSPESSYLDFRLHGWAAEYLLDGPCENVLNLGIGAGAWDDWLGYLLLGRGRLTNVDADPRIAETLAYRQRREQHPNPATVRCADFLREDLPGGFDVVTLIGSTAAEAGDPAAAVSSAVRRLASGGRLFYADFHHLSPPEAFLPIASDLRLKVMVHDEDRTLPGLGFYLFVARS
jgi:SAM-dependent methyltransferase